MALFTDTGKYLLAQRFVDYYAGQGINLYFGIGYIRDGYQMEEAQKRISKDPYDPLQDFPVKENKKDGAATQLSDKVFFAVGDIFFVKEINPALFFETQYYENYKVKVITPNGTPLFKFIKNELEYYVFEFEVEETITHYLVATDSNFGRLSRAEMATLYGGQLPYKLLLSQGNMRDQTLAYHPYTRIKIPKKCNQVSLWGDLEFKTGSFNGELFYSNYTPEGTKVSYDQVDTLNSCILMTDLWDLSNSVNLRIDNQSFRLSYILEF